MDTLTFALPKGRLQDEVLDILAEAGFAVEGDPGRKLVLYDSTGALRFLMAKPSDVPTYVEYGAAALGVVGRDVLREGGWDVLEPLGLDAGKCRLCLAGPAEWRDRNLRLVSGLRVASKFPNLARAYFQKQGISAEVIYLSGSIELGPIVGLADLIVDLVQSGRTLRENGLVELDTILESEAMLVVNRAAHKMSFDAIQDLIQRMSAVIERRKEDA